jgi:hypothetical protein
LHQKQNIEEKTKHQITKTEHRKTPHKGFPLCYGREKVQTDFHIGVIKQKPKFLVSAFLMAENQNHFYTFTP